MATANSINANSAGIVGYDGAGTFTGSTLTQHSLLLGSSTNHTISNLGVATNGQLPIGSTGADPTLATLTAGTGVSISNGAGSITINAVGSGMTWTVVSGATQAIAVNNGYFANRSSAITFSLPTTSAVGDTIAVSNINVAGGSVISYTTNQQIFLGNTSTTITSGSLTSTAVGDTIILVCKTANLTWQAVSIVGNWTVA